MLKGLSEGERVALVISECQQAMVLDEFRGRRDELARQVADAEVIPHIAELAAAFRERDLPVFHSWLTPHEDWRGFAVSCALAGVLKKTDLLRDGSPAVAPHPDLEPQDGDFVVARRTGMTSFQGTDLDALLRSLRVTTVVLVGVSINVAVHGTALEAVNRGYSVVVPRDCVAGVGPTAPAMLADIYPLLATVTDRASVVAALDAR
jgi:nicotinamidase-related amidase